MDPVYTKNPLKTRMFSVVLFFYKSFNIKLSSSKPETSLIEHWTNNLVPVCHFNPLKPIDQTNTNQLIAADTLVSTFHCCF